MTEQRLPGRQGAMRRRAVGAVCAATLVLGTAVGCSDSPEPEPLDQSNVSATPTPTETPEPAGPPTLPPEARGTSKKSAIAFVEHVIDVLNYTARTLDTRPLARLSAPDCAACGTISTSLEDIRARGGNVTGGAWRSVEAVHLATPNRDAREIRVLVHFESQVVTARQGAKPERHQEGEAFFTFFVGHTPGGWRLVEIERDQS